MRFVQFLEDASLKVAYILNKTTLSGGSKVIFEHVRLINRSGPFRAWVVSPSEHPKWLGFEVPFVREELELVNLSCFDLVVTTFYDQGFLYRRWEKPFLHLCQGFEGDYTAELGLEHLNRKIAEFYRLPYPKMVVSRCLVGRLKEVTKAPVLFIGQGLDRKLFQPRHGMVKDCILVVGQIEYPFKGVDKALSVASELKRLFPNLKLVRVSPTDTRNIEASRFPIDEFWVHVPPYCMPYIYGRAVLSICLPEKEGFGLPVLESIASGVPVLASDIPPFREVCGEDYPLCRSPQDAFELGVELLTNGRLFNRLAHLGIERGKQFSTAKLLLRLVNAFCKALLWGRKHGKGCASVA